MLSLTALAVVSIGAGTPAAGTLLVSGYDVNAVLRFDAAPGTLIGALDAAGGIGGPLGVTRGPDGRLYVASEATNQILRFESATGAFVDEFVGPGTGLTEPASVIFGPDRNDDGHQDLYVSSFDGDSILAFDGRDGASLGVFVTAGDGGLDGPDAGMTFGPDGNLYVPSYWSNQVLRYDGSDGSFIDDFLGFFVSHPRTLLFGPDGNMLVANQGASRVLEFDGDGVFVRILVSGIASPTGMALDSAGFLYVASLTNDAVYRYDAGTGALVDVVVEAGEGGLSLPTYVLLLEACPADVNGSGAVDFVDLLAILGAWGSAGGPEDVDGSGTVGFGDVLAVLGSWGPCA